MILMFPKLRTWVIRLFFVNSLTLVCAATAVEIPPCPEGTERIFYPSMKRPLWAVCKDSKGLYQGLLIQFSGQSEIIRIASVKDSLRNGREIRFGEPGILEERSFLNGALDGSSFIFQSEAPLGRYLPKPATTQDWGYFTTPPEVSILEKWLAKKPKSTIQFQSGRISKVSFGNSVYHFRSGRDGRIYSLDHPEMKGGFFIDPEGLWDLSPGDLKNALTPGFGSCKKYAGPLGRFTRHYDSLLFKKLPTEKKHKEELEQIRDRFIQFCVPKDLQSNLGKMECPPHLPSNFPPNFCKISISDRVRVPYDPKYFKFDFSFGYSPEQLIGSMRRMGIDQFLSSIESIETALSLPDGSTVQMKKTPDGLKLRNQKKNESNPSKDSWWEWHRIPQL